MVSIVIENFEAQKLGPSLTFVYPVDIEKSDISDQQLLTLRVGRKVWLNNKTKINKYI